MLKVLPNRPNSHPRRIHKTAVSLCANRSIQATSPQSSQNSDDQVTRNLKIMSGLLKLSEKQLEKTFLSQSPEIPIPFQQANSHSLFGDSFVSSSSQTLLTVGTLESTIYEATHSKQTRRHKKPIKRQCVAVDCEFVQSYRKHLLARICILNEDEDILMDTFVKPTEKVTNYITFVSGVTAADLEDAPSWAEIKPEVERILHGKTIIGHTIHSDLKVMEMTDWKGFRGVVDISKFHKYKDEEGRTMGLKRLSQKILGKSIQEGSHCPVEDALATMRLFKRYRISILQMLQKE